MTLRDCREETKEILQNAIDEADTITDILISHYVGLDRGAMLAKLDMEVSSETTFKIAEAINKLLCGLPIQYILGSCWFYGLEVKVGSGCFIPRSDTEILVKTVLGVIKEGESFVELCSGSGCISMAIAENMPNIRGAATELSLKALKYTEENLEKYPNIKIKRMDVLDPGDLAELADEWGEGFDVLVCNPPYIPTAEILMLQTQVQFEPDTALDGGETGLKYYRYIIANADIIMKPKHKIAFEVGAGQAPAVAQMLSVMGYATAIIKDYGGIERVVLGTIDRALS